jgi:hypothetical protein
MKIIPRSTSEALEFLRQVRILPDFDYDFTKKKRVEKKIKCYAKLKMKIIPRSTSEALEFLRQVRFLPDFDPDRAAFARCGEK